MRWRIFALVAFLCLAACGDDDSDFMTRPDGKESSSSATPKSSDSETSVSSSSNKVTEPVEVQNESSSSEASDAIRGTGFAPQFTVSTAGRVLQVQNAAGNTMAIFDMQGRLLLTKRIATSVESAILPHTGTFILKIGPRTMRVNAR